MKPGLVSTLICAGIAVAQTSPPPAQSSDRRITLAVVVTDKSGKPVAGLEQRDFTLLDNKDPQNIVSFRAVEVASTTPADHPPIEALLLIDQVNANFSQASLARVQIQKFLDQSGGELPIPVAIAVLTDSGTEIVAEPSRDSHTLLASLNQQKSGLRSITRSEGFYGAQDRVQLCIRAFQQIADSEAPRPGRKLIVWISPGWPLLTGPNIQMTNKVQASIFATAVDLSNALRHADITLSSIDPLGTNDAGSFRTSYYEQFVKGLKKPSQAQLGNLGLQVLAAQSGGRVLNSSNDIAGEIATCLGDASAYYLISFDAVPADRPDEYHALDVKLDKPGLTAHTRTGYYAQPEH